MNEEDIVSHLSTIGANMTTINIFGPQRDFALNLLRSENTYELFYAERGTKDYVGKFDSLSEAGKRLIQEVENDSFYRCGKK